VAKKDNKYFKPFSDTQKYIKGVLSVTKKFCQSCDKKKETIFKILARHTKKIQKGDSQTSSSFGTLTGCGSIVIGLSGVCVDWLW